MQQIKRVFFHKSKLGTEIHFLARENITLGQEKKKMCPEVWACLPFSSSESKNKNRIIETSGHFTLPSP
jgi:hypothetical protein